MTTSTVLRFVAIFTH